MKKSWMLALSIAVACAGSLPARAGALDDILSREKNPMVLFLYNASEACPVDFIGLGKDAGEALGLIAPTTPPAAAGAGAFADHVRNMQARSRSGQSRLQRVLNRFCIYSKLFGDGSCDR